MKNDEIFINHWAPYFSSVDSEDTGVLQDIDPQQIQRWVAVPESGHDTVLQTYLPLLVHCARSARDVKK